MLGTRLRALYESGKVVRMHAVPTIFKHTVAEHVYGMLCIAQYLSELNGLDNVARCRVYEAVLIHDAPEVWTGDIPAHMKKKHPDIERALAPEEVGWLDSNDIDSEPLQSVTEVKILRASDRLDLAMLCVHERSMGNTTHRIMEVFQRAISYAKEEGAGLEGLATVISFIEKEWLQ